MACRFGSYLLPPVPGLYAAPDHIHAAIGRVQLTKVGAWTRRRQEIAARFDAELRGVAVPVVLEGAEHVYHQYTVRLPEELADALVLMQEMLVLMLEMSQPMMLARRAQRGRSSRHRNCHRRRQSHRHFLDRYLAEHPDSQTL